MSQLARAFAFDFNQTLPGRFHFPARMTALPLPDGGVALVSPIPIDDGLAAELAALGEVRFLIAPNLLHHLYLGDAIRRYPAAAVLAPSGLRAKRPDLRIDGTLDVLPHALTGVIDIAAIEGVPSMSEHLLFHRSSRTLVVTDLVFNVAAPRGLMANLVLGLVGCRARLAQSRTWRFLVKDRRAAAASAERVLEFPFETLIMAHGDIVSTEARGRLAGALSPMLGREPRSPERRGSSFDHPRAAVISARSFVESSTLRAFQFSSRWASELVPGIGSIVGERARSHAMATCERGHTTARRHGGEGVTAALCAAAAGMRSGIASGKNGKKAIPFAAQRSTRASCPSTVACGSLPSVASPAATL